MFDRRRVFLKTIPCLAVMLGMAAAPAAIASTLPRVDLKEGELAIAGGTLWPSLGTIDAALDWGTSEDESWGLALMGVPLTGAPPGYFRARLPGLWQVAGRYVKRLGVSRDDVHWGWTLAGGLAPVVAEASPGVLPPPNFMFLQPAFVLAWRFRLFGFPSALRGTVGPVLSLGSIGDSVGSGAGGGADLGIAAWVWPNLEYAVRVSPRDEVTLGGNSLLGWRTTF